MALAERQELSTARGDDTTDAGRLFEEHSDRILGYCLRCLRNRAEAEDAVQTTFLYAHRALERGVVPESEYVWLHSIAKNVCRWQQRTTSRRFLFTEVDLDTLPGRGGGEADERELLMGLGEALSSIPESQRRALILREWQGLSSGEIATRLGMSAPATYALLTRARRSLAKALTALPQRPALSLNFGPLLLRLKGLFAGGTANVAATTAVVAGIGVGGVAIERAIVGPDASPVTPAPTIAEDPSRAPTAPQGIPSSAREAPTRLSVVGHTPGRSARDDTAVGLSLSGGATTPEGGGSAGNPGAIDGPRPDAPALDETTSVLELSDPAPAPNSLSEDLLELLPLPGLELPGDPGELLPPPLGEDPPLEVEPSSPPVPEVEPPALP